MPVYRDYDQAALDAQYNLRNRHPDHAAIFARWAEASLEARDRCAAHIDLAYGPMPLDRLDIFPADGREAAPVLIFIHGGYWQSLDKADFSFLAPAFTAAGVTLAVINYPLAPSVDMDAIVAHNRMALLWLRQNVAQYGGDPDRIYVSGHSAGGHLTAMLLATDWPAQAADAPAGLVKGGCAISGLYDLEPIRLCYLNEVLGMDAAEAARNSPIALHPAAASPLILSVGDDETVEFLRQQAEFAACWRAADIDVRTVDMPSRHHFTIMDALADPESSLFRAVAGMATGR